MKTHRALGASPMKSGFKNYSKSAITPVKTSNRKAGGATKSTAPLTARVSPTKRAQDK